MADVDLPETRYATTVDGLHIAYQVVGDGPVDLVYVPGWVSHLEVQWEHPGYAAFMRRLASFTRLIVIDRRGTGLSDRVSDSQLPTLEARMDDIRAVMDAEGSRRAAILGVSEGGPMGVVFAATYTERTVAPILYGTYMRGLWAADHPWGASEERARDEVQEIAARWGTPEYAARLVLDLSPSVAKDGAEVQFFQRFMRMAASPGAAAAIERMAFDVDVRQILPVIRVPTLVVQRAGDLVCPAAEAQAMARLIPGAEYVEVPGGDHLPWVADRESILEGHSPRCCIPDWTCPGP